jgi:hypothetical protein
VICADVKEVKTMNFKGSVKQDDEWSPHPPHSPNLAPSTSTILAFWRMHSKDAILQMTVSWNTVSHTKMEKVYW